MNFYIDEQYLTDILIHKEWSLYDDKTELTDEELIKVLKGEGHCSSIHSEDHPKFVELREKLGKQGYIKIERGWWNGDRVQKPFTLNGVEFVVGEQFSCGCAMKIHLEVARKYRRSA